MHIFQNKNLLGSPGQLPLCVALCDITKGHPLELKEKQGDRIDLVYVVDFIQFRKTQLF